MDRKYKKIKQENIVAIIVSAVSKAVTIVTKFSIDIDPMGRLWDNWYTNEINLLCYMYL